MPEKTQFTIQSIENKILRLQLEINRNCDNCDCGHHKITEVKNRSV